MNERLKVLIAVGASAAVNCRPCLEYHLAECDRLGVDRSEVKAAIDVGLMVNKGAAAKTLSHAVALLGLADEETKGGAGGCGCGA